MTAAAGLDAPRPARSRLLRVALMLDAVVTGANGLAYLVVADPLEDLLGLDAALLRGAGAFLAAFAVAVYLAATRSSKAGVLFVAACNVTWAVTSVIAAAAQWGSPTTTGTVWIVLQAVTVAGFAALQLASRER